MSRAEVFCHRADDHRAVAELTRDHLGRLHRFTHTAEDNDQPITLGAAECVHAGTPSGSAYLFEQVGFRAFRGYRAHHYDHSVPLAPTQGTRPGEHRLIAVGTKHGIDDQCLKSRIPGTTHLGRPGIDLGRRERDLARVSHQCGVHLGRVHRVDGLIDVLLDHIDAQSHQIHRLLQADGAGQRSRRHPEDRRRHRLIARHRVSRAAAIPTHKSADARLGR